MTGTASYSLARINAMDRAEFSSAFGGVYEHSPWVAEDAFDERPFSDLAAMRDAMARVVRGADVARQIALVQAHPELGHRAGIDPDLSLPSRAEQGSLGLDRLTAEEYAQFRALNEAYRARFSMPFVICVRRADKAIILEAMRARLHQTREAELLTALDQIDMIASLRLKDLTTS